MTHVETSAGQFTNLDQVASASADDVGSGIFVARLYSATGAPIGSLGSFSPAADAEERLREVLNSVPISDIT